ncbi:MAG TPA: hypothetical protein VNF47_26135 [Streptosporangiaceae bacterium]|nr:hypothetical protein [Streptosporangiaceae bacterium]
MRGRRGYADRWHRLQAMAVTQSGSRWARARELRMPSNANADPAALVNSVSCPRAGACVAVGYYSSGTRLQGFVASQTRSGWARAHRITLPANTAPRTFFQLDAVSCTGPGSCVVVGDYRDRWGHLVILAVTESGGRWHQARELRMPANAQADPEAAVLSVSCSRAGSCSAGGEYLNKANDFLPVAVTESGGRWHQGVAIKLPFGAAANPDAFLNSVTCTRPGSCVAVGGYDDTALNAYSFAVTQTAGVWSRAKKVATVPSDAAPHPRALLHSVTCTPSGGCAAVGNYLDTDGGTASYAALGRGARLIVARAIRLPSDAVTGGLMRTQLGSVSCTARGYCVAVGYYGAKSNRIEPMAASTPLH